MIIGRLSDANLTRRELEASLGLRLGDSSFLFQCTAFMFVEILFSIFSLVVLVFILFSAFGFDFSFDTAYQAFPLFLAAVGSD